jgi:hypothetical protein
VEKARTHLAVSAAAALKNIESISALVGLVPSAIVTVTGEAQHVKSVVATLADRVAMDSIRLTLRGEAATVKSVIANLGERAVLDSARITLRPGDTKG